MRTYHLVLGFAPVQVRSSQYCVIHVVFQAEYIFETNNFGFSGKPFAYIALKILVTSILQRFVIQADGTLHDLSLTVDVSTRLKNRNYSIKLKKRELQ